MLKQLLIRDRFQAERTQKALGSLHEIMKQNTQYYKEMDSIIDIVYKIVQRSAVAVEVINKNPNFIRFIE